MYCWLTNRNVWSHRLKAKWGVGEELVRSWWWGGGDSKTTNESDRQSKQSDQCLTRRHPQDIHKATTRERSVTWWTKMNESDKSEQQWKKVNNSERQWQTVKEVTASEHQWKKVKNVKVGDESAESHWGPNSVLIIFNCVFEDCSARTQPGQYVLLTD